MEGLKLNENFIRLNKYFGEKLKESRLKHDPPLSQEELAEKIGITRTTLSNYEAGISSPPWWFACIIAKYFGNKLENYSYFAKEDDRIENFS